MSAYQTVLPLAFPLYSGKRTVSWLRSTWIAFSRVRWSRGKRPLVRPRALAWADAAVEPARPTVAIAKVATAGTAAVSHHRWDGIFIVPPFLRLSRSSGPRANNRRAI